MKSKVSLISLIKGNNRYSNVKKALETLEPEIKKKIRGKKKILVKPNLVTAEPDRKKAVTHPDALRAVLDFIIPLKDQNAQIIIGEDCGAGNTKEAFKNFGYLDLEKEYHIELKDLSSDATLPVRIYSKRLKRDLKQNIFKTFLDSDFVISVGPPKTHNAVIVTLSLKNIVIAAIQEKYKMGKENFHQGPKALNLTMAILATKIFPHLSVLDAFEAMEGNGPSAGDIIKMNLALVSTDFLAADSIMTRMMGFNPKEIGYLYYCHRLGLGNMNLENIDIIGNTTLEDNIYQFKPHLTYFLQKRWKVRKI